ncbi:hypothetical protein DAPPUDRAFT_235923 [Daphnia pulex]|uniref:Uncharacterized protein n=1 Tax=Daphnia pulex TaxID=6669 RepID=E9FZF0_DAPPU|nr:hypothetical protein DAPPUDRAFT_235923 [Daphnia pulex]|eukprot:EFX87042.1 hypothetical protein DAPPUDRAFT_235923 [Daphnia pulex]
MYNQLLVPEAFYFQKYYRSDDWKSGSGVQNCGFYGNNSLILTTECRQAQDCSWYEQLS